jgi:hypothetical protein
MRGGGTIYYWSFSVMFVSATGLAMLHWTTDVYLFVIGAVAFGCASPGYWVLALHLQRRIGTRSAHAVHIAGMGFSYIALLTAFYVDNEPHLPVLRQLRHLSAGCCRVRSGCRSFFVLLFGTPGEAAERQWSGMRLPDRQRACRRLQTQTSGRDHRGRPAWGSPPRRRGRTIARNFQRTLAPLLEVTSVGVARWLIH